MWGSFINDVNLSVESKKMEKWVIGWELVQYRKWVEKQKLADFIGN